tara:strand:- start:14496 stop:14843 length:348 start_codon:yes stop_codon:yes gene_type:complete
MGFAGAQGLPVDALAIDAELVLSSLDLFFLYLYGAASRGSTKPHTQTIRQKMRRNGEELSIVRKVYDRAFFSVNCILKSECFFPRDTLLIFDINQLILKIALLLTLFYRKTFSAI